MVTALREVVTAWVPLPDDAFSIGPYGPLKKGLWSAHA
jgi:hypothetical protein